MPLPVLVLRLHDLPVCFPARPCVEFTPLEADVVNLSSTLTPVSSGIAAGCFVVIGVALVLVALGLRSQPGRRMSLWVVALATALTLLGILVAGVADVRFSAIGVIYGLEGSGGPAFYGSWWLVSLAGEGMTAAGLVAIVTVATVAVLRSGPPGRTGVRDAL